MNPAYYSTIFQALPEELPGTFCIVTAWNPDGKPDLAGTNRKRDRSLADRIDELALPRTRITGMSPDESHAEPGWAIACPVDQGLSLTREFAQEAIYWVSHDELTLISCQNETRQTLGAFQPRLRDPRNRRLFTLHLGCPSPRARFLPAEALEVRVRVANRFPSFTITEAEGCFCGQTEDALLISVATDRPSDVLELAEDLRRHFRQDGVGVSCNGIYQRVTAWSDTEFLLRVWGVAPALSSPGGR